MRFGTPIDPRYGAGPLDPVSRSMLANGVRLGLYESTQVREDDDHA